MALLYLGFKLCRSDRVDSGAWEVTSKTDCARRPQAKDPYLARSAFPAVDAEADSGVQKRVDPVVVVQCMAAAEWAEFSAKETTVAMVHLLTLQVVVEVRVVPEAPVPQSAGPTPVVLVERV